MPRPAQGRGGDPARWLENYLTAVSALGIAILPWWPFTPWSGALLCVMLPPYVVWATHPRFAAWR